MNLAIHPLAHHDRSTTYLVNQDGLYGTRIAEFNERHWAEAFLLAMSLGDLVGRLTDGIGRFLLASIGSSKGVASAIIDPQSELINVSDLAKEVRAQLNVLDARVDARQPPSAPAPSHPHRLH